MSCVSTIVGTSVELTLSFTSLVIYIQHRVKRNKNLSSIERPKEMCVTVRVEWRPALELGERGVGSNSQGSIAGPSTDSSPSSADDPPSSLQQVSSGGGGGRNRPTSDSMPNANSSNTGSVPNSGRNSQRRRSTRHQNYLNRSQLHQAVDLPDGYG